MKACKTCSSTDLVPNGDRFRNQCHVCWARTQRVNWKANRTTCLTRSKQAYVKHASKRRKESALRKGQHREYYTLAEWFRRKGIRITHIARSDLDALIEMKRAVNEAKLQIKHTNHD